MKKFVQCLASSFLLLGVSFSAQAKESSAGGIEFSGNATVLTGWQHDDDAALPEVGGEFALERGFRSPNRDTFNFYLDQFELDIDKSFGEKIRLRVDLDFGRNLSGSGRSTEGSNFVVEQAYVSVGVLKGELSIGRFNAPVGYYVVDRAFNPTISFSNIYNYLTPTNVTGAKMYWAIGDHFDINAYIMNNMFDCLQIGGTCLTGPGQVGDSAIPSMGMRAGFKWGQDDKASTVGLSYLAGPEQAGNNAHWDNMVDLDFSIKATEKLLLAGEGIYYQRNNLAGVTGPNAKFAGALLVLDYKFTDTWDLFGSYGYVHDFQGVVTGVDQQVHNFLVGFGYQITDGAKLKAEYRLDYFKYAQTQDGRTRIGADGPVVLSDTSSFSNGLALEMSYVF